MKEIEEFELTPEEEVQYLAKKQEQEATRQRVDVRTRVNSTKDRLRKLTKQYRTDSVYKAIYLLYQYSSDSHEPTMQRVTAAMDYLDTVFAQQDADVKVIQQLNQQDGSNYIVPGDVEYVSPVHPDSRGTSNWPWAVIAIMVIASLISIAYF